VINNNSQPDILAFCEDVDRGVAIRGKAASQILDPICDSLEEKNYKILRASSPDSQMRLRKMYKATLHLRQKKFLTGLFLKIKCILSNRFYSKEKRSEILNRFIFKKTLRNIRPKIVLTIDPSKKLCEIARNLNIKIVNLAHGYGYPRNCKVHGKKARANLLQEQEPNFFICFDSVTFNTRRVGDRQGITETILCDRRPSNHLKITNIRNEKEKILKILVALQWGYSGEIPYLSKIIPDGIMHVLLKELINEHKEIQWLLRFHPVHLRIKKYKINPAIYIRKNFKNHFNVLNVSLLPFEQVFSETDILITMSSASVYEAAHYGIPSIALCPSLGKNKPNYYYFQDLEKKGILRKVPLDKKKILGAIDEIRFKNKEVLPAKKLKHVNDVIEEILLK